MCNLLQAETYRRRKISFRHMYFSAAGTQCNVPTPKKSWHIISGGTFLCKVDCQKAKTKFYSVTSSYAVCSCSFTLDKVIFLSVFLGIFNHVSPSSFLCYLFSLQLFKLFHAFCSAACPIIYCSQSLKKTFAINYS